MGKAHKNLRLYSTALGVLRLGDCVARMAEMAANSVDVIFADPPFNIGKKYRNGGSDRLSAREYERWLLSFLRQAIRILKPGGHLFVYHQPKMMMTIGGFLLQHLDFQHRIVVKATCGGSRSGATALGRAYYELAHFSKGTPLTFKKPRRCLRCCSGCGRTVFDYGGKASLLNPSGLGVTDLWDDIPGVHHKKKRKFANELNVRLAFRVLDMAMKPGDVVLDAFSGSGTMLAACELMGRRWLGFDNSRASFRAAIARLMDRASDVAEFERHRSEAGRLLREEDIERQRRNGLSQYRRFPGHGD